jgi:hypothetical protein
LSKVKRKASSGAVVPKKITPNDLLGFLKKDVFFEKLQHLIVGSILLGRKLDLRKHSRKGQRGVVVVNYNIVFDGKDDRFVYNCNRMSIQYSNDEFFNITLIVNDKLVDVIALNEKFDCFDKKLYDDKKSELVVNCYEKNSVAYILDNILKHMR